MKTAIAIQARTGSTRLPRKVLKKIHKDFTLFHSIYNQLKYVSVPSEVVLCTSDSPNEKELIEHATELGLKSVTGEVDDIISRLYNVVKATDADYLIRIWGDCPFVCPDIIDSMFVSMKENNWEFISNGDFYSRTLPPGLDVEIYSSGLLARMNYEILDPRLREFPVEFVRKNIPSERFGFWNIKDNFSQIHLTIDYPEDFVAGTSLLSILLTEKDHFVSSDIFKLIKENSKAIESFSKEARNKEYVEFLKNKQE